MSFICTTQPFGAALFLLLLLYTLYTPQTAGEIMIVTLKGPLANRLKAKRPAIRAANLL
jgi:hypothetical protein